MLVNQSLITDTVESRAWRLKLVDSDDKYWKSILRDVVLTN